MRRLQELRRIIQEECDHLLLRKERLKEEVGASLHWFNANQRGILLPRHAPAACSNREEQEVDVKQQPFRAWSLDMLNGLADLDQLINAGDQLIGDGGGGGHSACAWNSPARRQSSEKTPPTVDGVDQRREMASSPSASTGLFHPFCSGSLEFDEMISGGTGTVGFGGSSVGFGGVDAWTQVPCCEELEAQCETLSSIAMAYKVLGHVIYCSLYPGIWSNWNICDNKFGKLPL